MHTLTITRTVYTFDELRELGGKAYEKARDLVSQWATPDSHILSDYLLEELRNIAGSDCEISDYRISYAQGDGVNIRADITLSDAPTPSVGPKFPVLEGVEHIRVTPYDRRYLGSCCDVSITWTDMQAELIADMTSQDEYAVTARVEDAVGEWYRDVCAHLYAFARADIEYCWNEDNLAEYARDSGYEFYEDGSPL